MKPQFKFVFGFVALAAVTSLVWLAACSKDEGGDDDSGSGDSSSFSTPDVNDPLSALVAVRFTSVPTGFRGDRTRSLDWSRQGRNQTWKCARAT